MGQSGRVRFSELRRAYRLIHECRDLGHDPAAWMGHAVEGLARLAGAQFGNVAEHRQPTPQSPPVVENVADCGWASDGQRALWWRLYAEEELYAQKAITFVRILALPHRFQTRRREQLVDDREWQSSFEHNELHRALGFGDLMFSMRWEGSVPFAITVVRSWGEAGFGARQRRLVHLFHHELWRYVGTALARRPGEPFAGLSPRLREVLSCLLEGDGEKQAALRLGLSRHTVHDYVTALYRRFGVAGRAELMAWFMRRAYPRGVLPKAGPPP
jgi:DNA-binding CsgD family transcriptional regulator